MANEFKNVAVPEAGAPIGINWVYDATGPKTYVHLCDDENQLIEMRTDTSAATTGSRYGRVGAREGHLAISEVTRLWG